MKHFLLILILSFSSVICAQDLGKVNLCVVMPERVDNIDAQQLSKLQTKIEAICARNEVGVGYVSDGFVIYPVIEIGNFDVVEGGMQTIYTTNLSITLIVKQLNGVGINSVVKTYKGNGYSKEKAVSSAISGISIQDGSYKQFIGKSRELIINYYETHCDDIIKQAKSLAVANKYEKAIAMLSAIPESIPSYPKVQKESKDVYLAYINNNCDKNIQKAKTLVAMRDFKKAANILSSINPKSLCYPEVESLLNEIKTSLDEKQKHEMDIQMQKYKDGVELEHSIIEANKEIAKSYYENQPQINYVQVINLQK